MMEQFSRLRSHVNDAGIVGGASRVIFKLTRSRVGKTVATLHSMGEPIFEQDWDLLIVLDACRLDLMEEVADEYAFLDEPLNAITSVGSTSVEWMQKTFTDTYAPEIAETAYVTANPHSHSQIDANRFALVDDVWQYGWDEDAGTVRPRVITDRTITVWNESSPTRLIAHYMQPHFPFLSDLDIRPRDGQGDVWMSLREGDYTKDRIWAAYRDNLERVLDEVKLLAENVDAESIVITSDHGNALGEFGMYGHPPGFPLSCLRMVPWVKLAGTGPGDYSPDTYDRTQSTGEGW